jgi:hypothetical protein
MFRVFVGEHTEVPEDRVLDRLARFDALLDPIRPLVELHLGWESSTAHLELLLERTAFAFVVDFENLVASGLDPADLFGRLPESRVAYAHARNLSPDHVEHPLSLDVEAAWRASHPATQVLWEPKQLSCAEALEVMDVD